MANKGSGYGGGGAGGGEYTDGNFTAPSAGSDGYSCGIHIKAYKQPSKKNILVKNNNINYPIFHLRSNSLVFGGTWQTGGATNTISKLTVTVPQLGRTPITSYDLEGSLGFSTNGSDYREVSSSVTLNGTYKTVTSKIRPRYGDTSRNLDLLINTAILDYNQNYSSATYPGEARTTEVEGPWTNQTTLSPGDILYVIIQAGGGGGGGADDDWNIFFNYGSGGGGGGGGGAAVIKVVNTYDYEIRCDYSGASGGAAGQNYNSGGYKDGGSGGSASLIIYRNPGTANSQEIGRVTVGGGGGGTSSSGNSTAGSGGKGGQCSNSGTGYTILRIIDGGNGGKGSDGNNGENGGSCATSGSSSDVGAFSISNVNLTINTANGSGGNTGSLDDKGGGGGASYLGNGGYY